MPFSYPEILSRSFGPPITFMLHYSRWQSINAKSLHLCSVCLHQWRVPQFALKYPCNLPPSGGETVIWRPFPPPPRGGETVAHYRGGFQGGGGRKHFAKIQFKPNAKIGGLSIPRYLMGQGKGYCSPASCQHHCLSLLGCVALTGDPPPLIKASTNPVCKGPQENEDAKAMLTLR